MNTRYPIHWAILLVAFFAACKDATTAPAKTTSRASFAVAADTGGGGGGPGNQSHFVANGDFGFVNWSGDSLGGGFTFGSLSVSRGGSVNNPQAFLSYFVEQCDAFFNCTFSQGFGQIPARDLSGGGKHLHLATNTSGNPNFFTFGGPAGLITVDWSANGFFTQRSTGTNDVTFPGFLQHQTGVSTSASAYASGGVVAIVIPSRSSGNIGTNQSVTIDITH
jgi:hypothetical protein